MLPAGARCMGVIFDVAPGYEQLLARHGLRDIEAVFGWSSGDRLDKPGLERWRQRWRITLQGDAAQHTVYLKRFDHPPLRRQLQRWRSGASSLSTAGMEWANARLLAQAGIQAAEPIAFGQQMAGLWERRSFIMLREVRGTSLERWVPASLPPVDQETDLQRRRRRLDRLARFVAAFHAAGFVHRDLYLSHVFIQPAAAEDGIGEPGKDDEFALIDLQRVFRPGWRHRRWVVKDLAALDYSTPADRVDRQERLRFLCRYVRECRHFGFARQLAKPIAAKTAWMIRRHRAGIRDGP